MTPYSHTFPLSHTPEEAPGPTACWGAVGQSPHASPFPLSSLDENANLGTVMRYEEIGKWLEKRGRLGLPACTGGTVGQGRGLEILGCVCNRVSSQNNGSKLEQILGYSCLASSREVGLAGLAIFPSEPSSPSSKTRGS